MSDATAGDPVECVPSPRATGADLPEELFENILRISIELYGKQRFCNTTSTPMPELLPLALVCRYFAKICRPRLYHHLALRSHRNVKGLTSLASPPSSFGWLFLLTKTLEIQCGDGDALWVHQVFTVLLPRLVRAGRVHPFPDVQIYIYGSIAGLVLELAPLPRPIPPSLLRHITTLDVQGVDFRCGDGLIRWLSSFGGLKEVKLTVCQCEADATPAAVRRFLAKPGHLERLYCCNSATCIPVGLLAIFCSEMRRTYFAWCSPEEAEYQNLVGMVMSLSDINPLPSDILNATPLDCGIQIEVRPSLNLFEPKPSFSFYTHLVSGGEEMYNLEMTIIPRYRQEDALDPTPLLDRWRRLATYMQNLRHLKKLSLEFNSYRFDSWTQTTAFMVVLRPIMQDLRASLSPGQSLVIKPAHPPGLFEDEEDHARYPYLGQSLYPEAVIAAMEEERKKWEEEKKKKEEQWKDMHERLERHIERREEQTEERGEKWEWERERDEEVWKKVDSEGKWMWMQEERAESGQLNEQPDSFDEYTLECGIANDFQYTLPIPWPDPSSYP